MTIDWRARRSTPSFSATVGSWARRFPSTLRLAELRTKRDVAGLHAYDGFFGDSDQKGSVLVDVLSEPVRHTAGPLGVDRLGEGHEARLPCLEGRLALTAA